MIFRAVWPITDEHAPLSQLIHEARADVPLLAGQARCRLVGEGRFWISASCDVPGSGRITETVLVLEAPAVALARRDYWRESA